MTTCGSPKVSTRVISNDTVSKFLAKIAKFMEIWTSAKVEKKKCNCFLEFSKTCHEPTLVGRPVDLTGRPMGQPMCCPVLKGACAYAELIFLTLVVVFSFVFFPSGFRGTVAFGPLDT